MAVRARGWVAAHLGRMDWAYALADVVIARAGASTIAELARCGLPACLIPYPYANGHQRENARVVASIGAGVWLEESAASSTRLLGSLRALLTDAGRRARMGAQMARLSTPDATTHLASAIVRLARAHAHSILRRTTFAQDRGERSRTTTSLRAMVSEGTESNHAQR